jgi:hypothetical protein
MNLFIYIVLFFVNALYSLIKIFLTDNKHIVDFKDNKNTIFITGSLGWDQSILPFSYYASYANNMVANIDKFSSLDERARNVYASIIGYDAKNELKPETFPEKYTPLYPGWSDDNPINLVGHSLGCNTIHKIILFIHKGLLVDNNGKKLTMKSINRIVMISPLNLGHYNALNAYYNVELYGVSIIKFFYSMTSKMWNFIMPEIVKKYIYDFGTYSRSNNAFKDGIEPITRKLSENAYTILRNNNKKIMTIMTNKCSYVSGYYIPYVFTSSFIIQVCLLFIFSPTSDNYIIKTHGDKLKKYIPSEWIQYPDKYFKLKNTTNDGIVSLENQMYCLHCEQCNKRIDGTIDRIWCEQCNVYEYVADHTEILGIFGVNDISYDVAKKIKKFTS